MSFVSAADNATVQSNHSNITSTTSVSTDIHHIDNNKTSIQYSKKISNKHIKNATANNYNSLRNQIQSASSSSQKECTINLNKGTYTATNTITLQKPRSNCRTVTINGNNAVINGQNKYGFMKIYGSYTINVKNLQIRNCRSTFDGSVFTNYNGNVKLNLYNVTLTGNSAHNIYAEGGAINLEKSTLNIVNSKFNNNNAYAGGAIYTTGGTTTITGSQFTNNKADYYGGAIFSTGTINIKSTTFTNNTAGYRGGAIHITDLTSNNGIHTLTNVNMNNNKAEYGGAISTSSVNTLTIQNSKLYNNKATNGAVVSRTSSGTTKIIKSNVYKNTATHGAVIYSIGAYSSIIENSNITGNTATEGAVIYHQYGRKNITNSNLKDNKATRKGLIYTVNGKVILKNNKITYNNKAYTTPVLYKTGYGDITNTNNNWGTNKPNYNTLIYNKQTKSISSQTNTNQNTTGDDCCSNIIQINSKTSVITFRRDSTSNLEIYITNDSRVRQQKTGNTYFFHSYTTPTGWQVGNGGGDTPGINEKIEALTLEMIKNNKIDQTHLQRIQNLKKLTDLGHTIIKSPNGTYGVTAYFHGTTKLEMGVLKNGDYIVSPNNPQLLKKGNIKNLKTKDPVTASRYLAATDTYGKHRHDAITYYYRNNTKNVTIDIYAANDDGSLVGRSDSGYCDDIYTDNTYTSTSQLPRIMKGKYLETVTYKTTTKNTTTINKTVITTDNITTYTKNIQLTAHIKDARGKNITGGKVVFKINNKTVKNINNSKYAEVKNGLATLKFDIPKSWRNNQYTISATYSGTSTNPSSKSTSSTLKIIKTPAVITTTSTTGKLGSIVTLRATIKDANDNPITNGKIAVKINGKTFGYTRPVNGSITYNLNLTPTGFGKYNYKVTFVYGGTNTIGSARINTILQVIPFNPKIDVYVNTTNVNDEAVMTVKITNSTGYTPVSGNVGFKINGKTYKIDGKPYTLKLSNGTATFKFNTTEDMIGENNITITYSGNSQFYNGRITLINALEVNENTEYYNNIVQSGTRSEPISLNY